MARDYDCGAYGCQLAEARRMLARAQELVGRYERMRMEATKALWCEQGEHSFSEKDPGMRVITISVPGADDESRTICGKCTLTIGRPQLPSQDGPASG